MGSIEDKLKTHIVYGNGESRPREPLSGNFTSWGCNAIYRDFIVDNLVVIDYPMQQEVYESDYPLTHKCWFFDWEVLPEGFDPHWMLQPIMKDVPTYETPRRDRKNLVVQGKTRELVENNILEAMSQNPNLVEKDLRQKMEKDIGLYITWVEEEGNDQVIDIDYPRGWSAGNTALYLACREGAEEIYMLGFDGSDYSKPINNVYKGSKNYLPEDSRGFNTINWDNQFKMIQRDFPNVKFYKVGTELTYEELNNIIR